MLIINGISYARSKQGLNEDLESRGVSWHS